MRFKAFLRITLALIVGFGLLNAQRLYAKEPVLESYLLSHGGTPGARSDGIAARLSDEYFGNGTAKARIRLKIKGGSANLFLRVHREVGPDEITPALLVFRVEIRGYDPAGSLLYSRDLDGFTFGDSKSGEWSEHLRDITPNPYAAYLRPGHPGVMKCQSTEPRPLMVVEWVATTCHHCAKD